LQFNKQQYKTELRDAITELRDGINALPTNVEDSVTKGTGAGHSRGFSLYAVLLWGRH